MRRARYTQLSALTDVAPAFTATLDPLVPAGTNPVEVVDGADYREWSK